jgi:DNA-binding transcriptional ArsR family regulator
MPDDDQPAALASALGPRHLAATLDDPTYNRIVVRMERTIMEPTIMEPTIIKPTITDTQADAVFAALADATRRDILSRAMGGDLGISELADLYPMSFAAVQKHVSVLERAGLVRKRPAGRRRLVTTDMDGLRNARAVLDHYDRLWRGRLDRMHELLEQDDRPPDRVDTTKQENRR